MLAACGRNPLDLPPLPPDAVDAGPGVDAPLTEPEAGGQVCTSAPAGVECAPARCDGVMAILAATCDGRGTCGPQARGACTPFGCDPATSFCRSSCASDADCDNAKCRDGLCTTTDPGIACNADSDCATGHCADGICCDRACRESCVSCRVPTMRGTCIPVPAGVRDPHGGCREEGVATCGHDGSCDGLGGCGLYRSGAVCEATKCIGATLSLSSSCDGKGACMPGIAVTCAPFVCDSADKQCLRLCDRNDQCLASLCEVNTCGFHRNSACVDGSECVSGFCSQGVCCDVTCQGPCVSCALPGTIGRCTTVPAGAPDPTGLCSPTR